MTCLTQIQIDTLIENMTTICGCLNCLDSKDIFSDDLYTTNTIVVSTIPTFQEDFVALSAAIDKLQSQINSSIILVATYRAMLAIGPPSIGMTTFKVAVDENKGMLNTTYQWWYTGKNLWIAANEDN